MSKQPKVSQYAEVAKKYSKLPPGQMDAYLDDWASSWIKKFMEIITNSNEPTKFLENTQEDLYCCILQLTKIQHRGLMLKLFEVLAKTSPIGQ